MMDTQVPARLLRYQDVVPDWDAFLDYNLRTEPVTLRARSLLHPPSSVRHQLESRGFQLSGIPGLDDYLRVDSGPHSVAQTLEHWLGQFHIQQCVMALPSMALAPEPGERVLDLCAAPGGKTAHLAELMEDRGCLVAVDPKEKRLRGLMANLFRLGHPNILVVASDGRELPGGARFDRVLVDAPCSAEGNFRRQQGSLPPCTESFREYVTHLQESLLRRGIALTRPGGTLVYSTCTFAPEENEAVLSRVLADAPVRMERMHLDLPHDPGLPAWGGETFHPDVRHAWRVYPHHLDSGGLFMARLRRLPDEGNASLPPSDGSPPDGWGPVPSGFPGEDLSEAESRITRARSLLETEYGFLPEWTRSMGWMVRAENIWLHTAGEWPVGSWKPSGGWRVVSLGLRAFREAGPGLETPSNAFLTRFADPNRSDREKPAESRGGGGADEGWDERWKELDRDELAVLLRRDALPAGDLPTGPLVLVFRGQVLGRGMVGRAGLRLEVPKAQARRLEALLETEVPLHEVPLPGKHRGP
jgi:tRNA (cytosine49-C5)-methyltransferase